MQNEQMEENKMGVMPVNRLLLTMSVPIMISMLVQALYNVVDSIFVAQLSEDALNAVSLAFPMQNLMISVATGTGVGISALLSKSLGEHDTERVQRAARNGVFLALVSFIVFAIIGVFFSRTFFQLQTDIPAIVDGGTQYLLICTLLSFGLFGQICFERLLQSTGKTFYTMITQGLGAILNIIFDPLFIFGIGPFPKMGVAGAAAATVLGQIVAFIVSIFINHAKNPEIQLSFKGFRPHGATIARIYAVGVPSIIMASISSVMTFGMNKILISFTSTATAVFGVYFKLQSFVFMPVFGLNNGMVPIIAYNFGARKPDRMKKTFTLAVVYATLIMVLGFAVMQLAPNLMLSFFNASDKMLEIGVPALRIISISFLLAGVSVICSSFFQALGHGMLSLWISVVRQLFVLLPVAYVLSRIGGLSTVWWAFPVAEVVALILCVVFLRYAYRKEIHPLEEAAQKA
ncbi:MATE family efflux transporter [Intestinibacillus sp. Marseille-P6563]|uniref:MATE family efflux transporter n=1 Tax=Intestinibacillus sp. Marseille-P6563 TaxID=2364792 RepID=UPI000F06FA2A|nr:MATE family efflux transporter [Intestinibacillus sp. Marseille-P6563]